MLNFDLKLNPKLFDPDRDQVPTRDGYGRGLVRAAEENLQVVALTADLKESTRVEEFAKKFPERFIECGVAEQNLAAVAAGLAMCGKIPFISSYATFSPGRNWEQIRTTVCYNNANVKIAGHHAGLSVGPDGATHQALEDIAIMRVLPNMKIFVPCDSVEAEKATFAAAQISGPVYLRFARSSSPVLTTSQTPFTPGKVEAFWQSAKPQAVIISAGPILHEVLAAAKELAKAKIGTLVLNCHTIKPLDEKGILSWAKKIPNFITVEEHQIIGGLGSAVAELISGHGRGNRLLRLGIHDSFGQSGQPSELFRHYGLDGTSLVRSISDFISK